MSFEPAEGAARESGRRAIAAIRNGLAAFRPDGPDAAAAEELLTFVKDASSSDVYHLVAIAGVTIRWASHETGRSEADIVNELAKNYGD
jgi:hypothetical protein